jgi:hypothetical protein
VTSTPDYLAYHDDEWGRPATDERGLFERTTLEALQSCPVVADDPAQAERVAGRFRFREKQRPRGARVGGLSPAAGSGRAPGVAVSGAAVR